MKLVTINKNEGNPFKYFNGMDSISGCHRSYKNHEEVSEVLNGLASILDLHEGIDCLEIGAGGNSNPSEALTQLGAKVVTLDADWSSRHTDIPKFRNYLKETDKGILIPHKAGQVGKVATYLGDMIFLRDEKSALRNEKFDLIYFWGSLFGYGICSSVDRSSTARLFEIKVDLSERMMGLIPSVKEGGQILIVSAKFNGHASEDEQVLRLDSKQMIGYALYMALGSEKEADLIGLIGGSNHIDGFDNLEGISIKMEKGSRFYNEEKIRPKEILENEDQEKIRNLGVIDAVFVQY